MKGYQEPNSKSQINSKEKKFQTGFLLSEFMSKVMRVFNFGV